MNRESLDELDRVLKGKTWVERIEEVLLLLAVIGGIYWIGHLAALGFKGFQVVN